MISDLIAYMKGIKNIYYDKTTLTDIVLLNYYYGNEEQAEREIERGRKSYRIGLKELQFIMEVLKVGEKR